jgi:hypothetical protein
MSSVRHILIKGAAMKFSISRFALALAGAGLVTLYGCGGGGGGSTSSTPSTTLSGVAATGAAFEGAVITVTDSTGATVGTSSAVGANGAFNITLRSGAVAPFVLTATRTNADGAAESLVSVVPNGGGTIATVNISPVTTLIASRLSVSGDPTKLAAEVGAGTSTVNSTTVSAKVAEVQTILAPILTATGTTGTDPLTGTFAADGTGYDRLLDSIKVTITPASSQATNIEVSIKQQQVSDTAAPTAIQFTSATSAASLPTIPTINSADLVPSGTSALIAAHLAQLNACYALPAASRVNGTTASSIIASACTAVFKDSDPTTFKSNGKIVGQGKAFSSMFTAPANGVVFSQGTYEFTRANGDIVVGYKSRDLAGNELFDTFALTLNGGQLRQIGNQYNYPGGVSAYHQLRKFVTLSQSAWDYYSTGYTLNVDHITGGAGVDGSVFDRIEVTTPRGHVLVLKPKAGSSYLPLVKNPGGSEVVTGTNFLRLNSVYADSANTADPSVKDTTLFFADRTLYPDATISTIPAQSVWKFDYFLAGNTGATADTTQYYKTRARALTIAELQTKGFATLLSGDLTWIASNSVAFNGSNGAIAGRLPFSAGTAATMNWAVGTGVLPPTSIQIWGTYNDGTHSGGFNDSTKVGSTARTGDITCSNSGGSDFHCASGAYTTTTYLNGSHLWARDTSGREYASFFAMYKL